MLVRTVPVLLLSVGLLACGASLEEKEAGDPWSTFTGKYSRPAAPREKTEAHAHKDKKAKAESAEKVVEETSSPIKASSATIGGESLSSIGLDTLTDSVKKALKQKFVANGVVTGPEYEMVTVELKDAKVRIVRRAESPAPNGPAISTTAKRAELSANDAAWYDEDADVLVIVSAGKKSAAQKALRSIVKH
jgi:hypothetical protein